MKSSKSKGKINARTRGLKNKQPAAGPGLSGALGPCVKMGKKCRGAAKVSWTSHAGKGAGKVKKMRLG